MMEEAIADLIVATQFRPKGKVYVTGYFKEDRNVDQRLLQVHRLHSSCSFCKGIWGFVQFYGISKLDDAKSARFISRYLLEGSQSRDDTKAQASLLVQINTGNVQQIISPWRLCLRAAVRDRLAVVLLGQLHPEAPGEFLVLVHIGDLPLLL